MKSSYRIEAEDATATNNARVITNTPVKQPVRQEAIYVAKVPQAPVVGKEKVMLNAPQVTTHPYKIRAIAALAERMVGKLKPADNREERLAANA